MKKIIFMVTWPVVAFAWIGCFSITNEEEFPAATVTQDGDRILIVDKTGKQWDVTHAVNAYGFDPSGFQFGLGPNAIPPIIDSGMLLPGDRYYPDDWDTFLVIGTTIGGESRAYPIHVLNRHEIVDESFGDVHVAVGW
ncbi:MAG: DUF3179 domain-containing protein [Candidatus Latescibacterota bacterium]|nr:MAG: DUF3179 domain-containing protein [Candidatus Latescibacterota bacterium]